MADVIIYDQINFLGRSIALKIGDHTLTSTGAAASIKVPKGLVACVYQYIDQKERVEKGGSADFLEDCADLSKFGLNGKVTCINVFNTENGQYVWVRGRYRETEFIPPHWERKRSGGSFPDNSGAAVVSPPRSQGTPQPTITSGGTTAAPNSTKVKNVVIQTFDSFSAADKWRKASAQMGVIGSDFRGKEEIGSAAFERAFTLPLINFLNFWYPQKPKRDHTTPSYYKRTLSGTIHKSEISDRTGFDKIIEDSDLNLEIKPAEGYEYLIAEGHPREYTELMKDHWKFTLHQSGQASCDDSKSKADFTFVHAEIDSDPEVKQQLNLVFSSSIGKQVCVYGPWIYDKGHCCHSEIHPAEQIWWNHLPRDRGVYFCNLICDSSRRFWWRHQMDDGTKLKPWAAPPITGTFAIAFETAINSPAKQFVIRTQQAKNHVTIAESFERQHLVYKNNTLISVVQDTRNLVKVSFEDVGLVGSNNVRGFIVIEATVGKCIQNENPIKIPSAGGIKRPKPTEGRPERPANIPGRIPSRPSERPDPRETAQQTITLPPNTVPESVSEQIEPYAFRKEAGYLMLMIAQVAYKMP